MMFCTYATSTKIRMLAYIMVTCQWYVSVYLVVYTVKSVLYAYTTQARIPRIAPNRQIFEFVSESYSVLSGTQLKSFERFEFPDSKKRV